MSTESVGGPHRCVVPVRLAGHVDHVDIGTGEMRRAFGSDGQPGGVVRVRCNNRRESVCPACSKSYKGDARQIVMSGLAGGKGVPAAVGGHPALFVTLTAPSFGAVHSRRSRDGHGPARVCRPRRGSCVHGRPVGCHERHGNDDRRLGEPLCADCYDYPGHVVWNALVPRLWKVTRDRVESALAADAGLSVTALRRAVRVTFVKVAEMQARGVVHLHAVIRLDGRDVDDPAGCPAPPGWADTAMVERCLPAVLGEVAVAAPVPDGDTATLDGHDAAPVRLVRWGTQVDIRPIRLAGEVTARRVSNYIGKYTTKSVHDGGLLDRPIRSAGHLRRLGLPGHARRLVETCWRLGADPVFAAALDEAARRVPGRMPGLSRWAHQFGFGGHWLSKSRWYSTTFRALRDARRSFARIVASGGQPVDAFGRRVGDPRTVTVGRWAYAGQAREIAGRDTSLAGPPRAGQGSSDTWWAEG